MACDRSLACLLFGAYMEGTGYNKLLDIRNRCMGAGAGSRWSNIFLWGSPTPTLGIGCFGSSSACVVVVGGASPTKTSKEQTLRSQIIPTKVGWILGPK